MAIVCDGRGSGPGPCHFLGEVGEVAKRDSEPKVYTDLDGHLYQFCTALSREWKARGVRGYALYDKELDASLRYTEISSVGCEDSRGFGIPMRYFSYGQRFGGDTDTPFFHQLDPVTPEFYYATTTRIFPKRLKEGDWKGLKPLPVIVPGDHQATRCPHCAYSEPDDALGCYNHRAFVIPANLAAHLRIRKRSKGPGYTYDLSLAVPFVCTYRNMATGLPVFPIYFALLQFPLFPASAAQPEQQCVHCHSTQQTRREGEYVICNHCWTTVRNMHHVFPRDLVLSEEHKTELYLEAYVILMLFEMLFHRITDAVNRYLVLVPDEGRKKIGLQDVHNHFAERHDEAYAAHDDRATWESAFVVLGLRLFLRWECSPSYLATVLMTMVQMDAEFFADHGGPSGESLGKHAMEVFERFACFLSHDEKVRAGALELPPLFGGRHWNPEGGNNLI